MEVGEVRDFPQQDMDALVQCRILRLAVQGMVDVTARQAANFIPELITVRNWEGNVEFEVLSIVDCVWTLKVIKAEAVPE